MQKQKKAKKKKKVPTSKHMPRGHHNEQSVGEIFIEQKEHRVMAQPRRRM